MLFGLGLAGSDANFVGEKLESAVEVKADDQIGLGLGPNFSEEKFDEEWSAEDLFEIGFELGTEAKADQAAQADIFGSSSEGFHVSGVNGGLADFFDIGRVAEAGESMAVE